MEKSDKRYKPKSDNRIPGKQIVINDKIKQWIINELS
jgi:hypothetical protein